MTTKEPPLIVTSPVKVLPSLVSSKVPLPVFVSPDVPATTEATVARLPAETETAGAEEPVGAAKVSVLPVSVKSAPVKTKPPMVVAPLKVAVPAVPVK